MLIIAASVLLVLGETRDAIVILIIVALNAALGFSQEYRAERAMAALKRLAVPEVRVRRDGQLRLVSARELVQGDLVLLEAGSLIPADGRVLEAVNLRAQESALTGESQPVDKQVAVLDGTNRGLGDRHNMMFFGSAVTYGRGIMVVTATGMRTELGRLAQILQTVQREISPLQRRLAQLGKGLALAALVLVALVFALGVLRGEDPRLMFMTALSLAVAVVPEGLPTVSTITLALGAGRMLRRNALIRKLTAVETLGSVTVICSDKTGTLTQNRMTVTILDVAGHHLDLQASLKEKFPKLENTVALKLERPELEVLLIGAALCNDAELSQPAAGQDSSLGALGDPTEAALVVAAARFGLNKPSLEISLPRVSEYPFDAVRKRMTTVHALNQTPQGWSLPPSPFVAFSKGATDGLLEVCRFAYIDGRCEKLSSALRERILKAQESLAARQMRVLGVAFQTLNTVPTLEALEQDLVFVGLIGMIDPPRPEVRQAVATCRKAGHPSGHDYG